MIRLVIKYGRSITEISTVSISNVVETQTDISSLNIVSLMFTTKYFQRLLEVRQQSYHICWPGNRGCGFRINPLRGQSK